MNDALRKALDFNMLLILRLWFVLSFFGWFDVVLLVLAGATFIKNYDTLGRKICKMMNA